MGCYWLRDTSCHRTTFPIKPQSDSKNLLFCDFNILLVLPERGEISLGNPWQGSATPIYSEQAEDPVAHCVVAPPTGSLDLVGYFRVWFACVSIEEELFDFCICTKLEAFHFGK